MAVTPPAPADTPPPDQPAPPSPEKPEKVPVKQVNVRLPVPLIEAMEARRRDKKGPDGRPLSQSKWMERALWYALTHSPQTQNPANARTRSRPARRTPPA